MKFIKNYFLYAIYLLVDYGERKRKRNMYINKLTFRKKKIIIVIIIIMIII